MKKILAVITCFFIYSFSLQAQTFYSMTSEGGSRGVGVIFSYDPASATYKKLYDFDSTNGSSAAGSLVRAANGKLYGVTSFGGSNDFGVIFSFDPVAPSFTKLLDFDYNASGGVPVAGLVEAPNGKLYGMTSQGGVFGSGVIFSLDPSSSTYTKLLDFDNDNGNAPNGSLIVGSDGKLYGTTGSGGTNNYGVIFSYDPLTNTYAKLREFDYFNDGGHPYGTLLQAKDGKLYGTTSDGGPFNFGVVFSYDPATSVYLKLKDFEYDDITFLASGAYPWGGLIQARDGKLYGMTSDGGDGGNGVMFSIDPVTSAFSKLENFDFTDGSHPFGDITEGADGKLYGMTYQGGNTESVAEGRGVIFSFDPIDSVFTKLKEFIGPEGANPYRNSKFITVPEGGPLPLSLISFSGKNSGSNNQLTWKVANELLLSYYDLERSNDGQSFKGVAQIKAMGNSAYNYNDPIAAAVSSLYYYRLKSVDKDGRFAYSPVLKIKRDIKGLIATVNPNPFKDRLVVNVESLIQDKAVFILTDLNGRQLYKGSRLLSSGSNVIEINESARLAKGTYLLTIFASQKNQTIKVIKAE